jgi:anti-sigma regulatory factor (Ser/Thr protein kinase)
MIVSTCAELIELRETVRSALAAVPAIVANDMVLAIDEATANALRHGSGGGAPVTVGLAVRDGWVEASVVDAGPTRRLPRVPRRLPDALATGGRGLWLIGELTDEVRVERAGRGTRLTMRRRLSRGLATAS